MPTLGQWIQIRIEALRLRCRATALADGLDPDHPDAVTLWECQNVPRADRLRGFGHMCPIDPEPARASQFRRQGAGFEEPRMPQPFVDPDTLGRVVRRPSLESRRHGRAICP